MYIWESINVFFITLIYLEVSFLIFGWPIYLFGCVFSFKIKEEMLDYLNSEFGGFEGTDNFSAEEAIYWYAYHNHGGQWSNLYSALSTSQYKPSPMMKSIEDSDDEISIAMYNTLVEKFGGEEISFDGYESDFD